MTGWNMPPGVNPSDIPGNRPEDAYWEKVLDDFYAHLNTHSEMDIQLLIGPELELMLQEAIQFGINLGMKEAKSIDPNKYDYLKEE